MLELIGENDVRSPCIVKNECSNRKCYRCDKFSRCIILNNGGDLLPSNNRRKAK